MCFVRSRFDIPARSWHSPSGVGRERNALLGCIDLPWARLTRAVAAVLTLAAMALAVPAEARKVALVIGNSRYANTTSLGNPPNDASLVARSASEAGFEVTVAADQTNQDFQRTLRDFRAQADGADVAMIYYAGHAIEGQGRNWLIPVDARLETEFDLPYEAINLDRLLEAVSGSRVRMLVLDSCRNNPFGNSWRRGVRAVPSGLAGVEIDDVLIIYAAAPGQVAMDGVGENSPFAESLARRLVQPGLPLQLLGGAIRDDVLATTGGKQRPFVSASMSGQPVYLVEQARAAPAPMPAPPAAPTASDRMALEALAWQGASASNSLAGFRTFLAQFPDGLFANMARESMARLEASSAAKAEQSRTPMTNEAPPALVETPPALAASPAVLAGGNQTALVGASASSSPITDASVAGGVAPTDRPAALALAAAPAPAGPLPVDPAPVAAPADPPAALAPPSPSPSAGPVQATLPPVEEPAGLAMPAANPAISSAMAALEQKRASAKLPLMPAAPRFSDRGYPACTNDYQGIPDPLAKVDAINRCTVALDQFYAGTMHGFRQQMIAHQDEVSRLYTEQVGGNPVYTPADQEAFFRAMRAEHSASNPDGANFADYRAAEARYRADRQALQERYCQFAGCDAQGRPTLTPVPVSGKKKK